MFVYILFQSTRWLDVSPDFVLCVNKPPLCTEVGLNGTITWRCCELFCYFLLFHPCLRQTRNRSPFKGSFWGCVQCLDTLPKWCKTDEGICTHFSSVTPNTLWFSDLIAAVMYFYVILTHFEWSEDKQVANRSTLWSKVQTGVWFVRVYQPITTNNGSNAVHFLSPILLHFTLSWFCYIKGRTSRSPSKNNYGTCFWQRNNRQWEASSDAASSEQHCLNYESFTAVDSWKGSRSINRPQSRRT